jgi:MYXO-CTERM domain-containing protein
MSPAPAAAVTKPVTRADIEAKLAEIRGVTDETTEVAEGAAKTGLVVAAFAVVIVAFLVGRRRGRKKNTIVEIRRV